MNDLQLVALIAAERMTGGSVTAVHSAIDEAEKIVEAVVERRRRHETMHGSEPDLKCLHCRMEKQMREDSKKLVGLGGQAGQAQGPRLAP